MQSCLCCRCLSILTFFFFFQAEDGIRDLIVTGVQTCALPIFPVTWHRGMSWRPDWRIIRELFRFGLPTGVQGIAMNIAGVLLLRYIGSLAQSAQAQAAYAVGYTELFSFITWTSVGLMSAAATVGGQNLGAGRPDRAVHGVHVAAGIGLRLAAPIGVPFLTIPPSPLRLVGMTRPGVVGRGVQLLR